MANLNTLRAHIARRGAGFALIEEPAQRFPAIIDRHDPRRQDRPRLALPRRLCQVARVFQVVRGTLYSVPVYQNRRAVPSWV